MVLNEFDTAESCQNGGQRLTIATLANVPKCMGPKIIFYNADFKSNGGIFTSIRPLLKEL